MADTKLQTILHISDLHFGDGGKNADIPNDISWIRPLEGLLGHHWPALEQLERFVRRLTQDDPSAVLVVSGDLTVNGARRQFDVAEGFLGHGSPKSSLGLELGFPNWLDRTVPGNHDHWPGFSTIFGPPTQAFRDLFPDPFPILPIPVQIGRNVTLQYIFFDTDAEVSPISYDRFRARGRFRQQISELDKRLKVKQTGEIRVLILHHAILDLGPGTPAEQALFPRKPSSQPPMRFEIEPGSLAMLEKAIVQHEIQVVMSGHLHVPRLTALTARSDKGTHEVFDARCGTTTQRDGYPKALLAMMKSGREPLQPNCLIVHEIWQRQGHLVWKAQVYWRSHASGFVPHGRRRSFDLD